MRNLAYPVALSFAVMGIYPANGAQWTNISSGLTGSVQGIRSLAIDRTGLTLFALGNNVFRSTDGGSNWNMLGGIASARVLALDPSSGSTVYVGAQNGIWKSSDRGEHWNLIGLAGTPIGVIAIDPITPSTLYAAGITDHVYKSTDGGVSWAGFAVGFPSNNTYGIASITIDPASPSTLYLIPGGLGFVLYKSTDGASTWSVATAQEVVRILAITPSIVYAIVAPVGLATSTDGGATWTGIGLMQDVGSLAIDPDHPNTIYASASAPAGTAPSIFKTTDGGRSWSVLKANFPIAPLLQINPANPSVLYAWNPNFGNPSSSTHTSAVFKSSDAGTTWTASDTGIEAQNIDVLVADPAHSGSVYAGGDGGLFKNGARAENWTLLKAFSVGAGSPPPGLPPPVTGLPGSAPASVQSILVDPVNPNTLYVGTSRIGGCFIADILLYKSADSGTTWSDSINPDQSGCSSDTLMAMDPADPNTLYLRSGDDYDGYGLRKSTDGGVTWHYTGLDGNMFYVLAVDPTQSTTLYAGIGYGVIQSNDGGATWNPRGLANMGVKLLSIDPRKPNTIYAAAIDSNTGGLLGLFKTADRGASWSPINKGLSDLIANHVNVNALVVDSEHPEIIYLGTSGYGVFKTSDRCAIWTAYNDGLTFLDVRRLAIGRGGTVYAGTPGGVFTITDATNVPPIAPRHGVGWSRYKR